MGGTEPCCMLGPAIKQQWQCLSFSCLHRAAQLTMGFFGRIELIHSTITQVISEARSAQAGLLEPVAGRNKARAT